MQGEKPSSNRGRRIYEEKLKEEIETDHIARLVAVEPYMGEYSLSGTDAEALQTI